MATFYVTPAGAGAKDGAAWASAFGEAEFEADLEGCDAGDIYYVASGAADGTATPYTLDSAYDSSARNGTGASPVSIIGVKYGTSAEPPAYSDWGSALNRPHFVCGANAVTFGNYYKLYNCSFTGTSSIVLISGQNSIVFNCKIVNTASSYALDLTANAVGINCEAIATSGYGVIFGGTTAKLLFSYIHDSANGIYDNGGAGAVIAFNFIDTAGIGIYSPAKHVSLIINNTIYNTTTAISATTSDTIICINNIIDTATDGFKWSTEEKSNFFWQNHEGNNVTDMWDMAGGNVTAPHDDKTATSGDPKITNAATGKCDLASDSPCLDAGMGLAVGVTATSQPNQGAWEADTPAGGAETIKGRSGAGTFLGMGKGN